MVNHYYRFHVCFSVLCKHCQQARNIIIISLAWILNEELNTLSMIYKKQRPKSEQDRTFFSLDLKPCPKVTLFRSNLWSANFSQKNERTNLFHLLFHSSRQTYQICPFVFWENLRIANLLFDFIWPLFRSMTWFHKWVVKNGFTFALQFFMLTFEGLGGVKQGDFMQDTWRNGKLPSFGLDLQDDCLV